MIAIICKHTEGFFMLTVPANGETVHYPAKPEKFEFDSEVSQVFPDMARRSIPLFYETHDLHAALCAPWMEQEQVAVLDVGASRGAFLSALARQYGLPRDGVYVEANDISLDMATKLVVDFPWVKTHNLDISGDTFMSMPDGRWDIINCTYVLQFVKEQHQVAVLRKLTRLLKPGGVLFLGQKLNSPGVVGRMLHDQYIQFRIQNGYTHEEIAAKTRALQNSMWPMSEENLNYYLNLFGLSVMETSRWTVFNNYMCTKGL